MNPVRSRWVASLAGVATVLATSALGRWQLQRADEKLAAAAVVQRRATDPALTNADWPCAAPASHAASSVLPVQRPASLSGLWVRNRTVLLDNRPMDGRSGFEVVTPLRLSTGPCAGRVVLVQRGWVPRDAQDRQRLPTWQDTAAEVRVPGRVVAQLSRTYALADEPLPPLTQQRSALPLIRQNADEAFWQAWLGQSPLVGAMRQTEDEVVVQAGTAKDVAGSVSSPLALQRHWAEADAGVGKHQAYAAQWFAMSAVAAGLTLWFQVIRPRWRVSHLVPDSDPSASHP